MFNTAFFRLLLSIAASAIALSAHAGKAIFADSVPTAQESEIVTQLIIRYKDEMVQPQMKTKQETEVRRLSQVSGEELTFFRDMALGAQVLKLPRRMTASEAQALAKRLAADPAVAYVEPDWPMYALSIPNDPLFATQWYLNDSMGGINAPVAWDITTGSASTVVAVLDTGFTVHPDLVSRLLPGYDFISDPLKANDGDGRDSDANDPGDWINVDDKAKEQFSKCTVENSGWHGTAVAGTIAAATQNGTGVAGIDWQARILPVRVLGKCGGLTSDIADGMLWAAGFPVPGVPNNPNPAKILNLSLGGNRSCSTTYQSVLNQIIAAGEIVVASAGNDNNSDDHAPSSCNGVISVAATARNGSKASYSNFGSKITLAAPGGGSGDFIVVSNNGTTVPGQPAIGSVQGTSFSAPVVSGIVSLMAALLPNLDAVTAKKLLQGSARPFPDASCTTDICGAGIADAAAAVRAARDQSLGVATFIGFQDADVGRPNPDIVLKITNFSPATVFINTPSITGAADFSINGNSCSNGLAGAGTSCNFSLRFNPYDTGLHKGQLSFAASDGQIYYLDLSGFAYPAAKVSQLKAGSSGAPLYLTYGPDGNFWYTQPDANRIARMSLQGWVSEYPLPSPDSNPFAITTGADGNLWFTELDGNRIGRITPAGTITEYPVPTAASQPRGITAGPDGNIWFTEISGARIGRITPQGTLTEFVIPWENALPRGITQGPDGNLWFTDSGAKAIGRITPTGMFTRFNIPWNSSSVRGITTGPDGNLWFVESVGNRIGRVTIAGTFTEFPLPQESEAPIDIAAGADGALWATLSSASRLARITTSGQISEYRLPSAASSPIGIANGPNNRLWIANSSGRNSIAILTPPNVAGPDNYQDMWWLGPQENGWGISIAQHRDILFSAFYIYDQAGKPQWVVMPGGTWNADYTTFSGAVYIPSGSWFGNYDIKQFNAGESVGFAALHFTARDQGTFNYSINGVSGSKTITRQLFPVDYAPGLNVGDMWWAGPQENGWGINIAQQYRTLFAVWFTYDQQGKVTWFVLPGGAWSADNKTYSGKLYSTTSSPWLGAAYNPAQFIATEVGTLSFNFIDANNAVMSYSVGGVTQTKNIVRQGF